MVLMDEPIMVTLMIIGTIMDNLDPIRGTGIGQNTRMMIALAIS